VDEHSLDLGPDASNDAHDDSVPASSGNYRPRGLYRAWLDGFHASADPLPALGLVQEIIDSNRGPKLLVQSDGGCYRSI
jgi:hypothetical protein